MAKHSFTQVLREHNQISITVKGRRSGRNISIPVWFVLQGEVLWLLPVQGSRTEWYRNLLVNPMIAIRAGRTRRTVEARTVDDPQTVKKVIEWFQEKYTPSEVARYYTGLDVSVEVSHIE
jgi:deazaflavin-dependent oxidoreductase (nitroreductase family)